jgi:predicted metalloprotease with PDZ domain
MRPILAVLLLLATAAAAAAPATTYTLDLSDRHAQDLHVAARFAAPAGEALDVHLPVWRTGLYRVLDPVGTVSGVRAEDARGRPLPIEQTAKSSWRVSLPADAAEAVTVRYTVYANSLGDRTRHVDADHAFVNPGPTLVYGDGYRDAPVEVRIPLPDGWRVASGMEQPEPGVLVAPDYDRLVDSPIEAGTFESLRFEAAGIDVEIAIHGTWDGDAERLRADVGALVEATVAVFDGEVPVERYLFLTHVAPGLGGGTEYWNSTVVHAEPQDFWDEEGYESFMGLLAHEFFHTWNVKRARPAGIARYDYLAENYTELLWVAEGLTSYYDLLLPVRAGLVDVGDWRADLAEAIDRVVDRPGYGRQSLAAASLEAWTKGFRSDADRRPDKPNRTVSFYSLGALLGLVLDLEIRAASDGARSLDDVMLALYRDFPYGSEGFTHGDVRERVVTAGGEALGERLDAWVLGTEPLPLAEALASVGWVLDREAPEDDDPAWLGASVSEGEAGAAVRWVHLGGPAHDAGVNAGDTLLALDGARIAGVGLDDLLERHAPGSAVDLALFRDGRLRSLPVTLTRAVGDHEITRAEDVDEASAARRHAWLGGRDETEEEED